LEEKDDRTEDEDFAEHRVAENLLQRLIRDADSQGANDGAEKAADSANNDRHEAIDYITLAKARTDVANLANERTSQSREPAAERET
jgi:hypothetical protein